MGCSCISVHVRLCRVCGCRYASCDIVLLYVCLCMPMYAYAAAIHVVVLCIQRVACSCTMQSCITIQTSIPAISSIQQHQHFNDHADARASQPAAFHTICVRPSPAPERARQRLQLTLLQPAGMLALTASMRLLHCALHYMRMTLHVEGRITSIFQPRSTHACRLPPFF